MKIEMRNIKHPYWAAFILGALSVLGLAPLFFWPVYVLCFALFLNLLFQTETKKQLFRTGWCFGFGFFIYGLYWISVALHIDWEKWWWLMPLAAIGLPLVLSVYYGLAAWGLHWFRDSRPLMAAAAVILFSGAEYLRGILFTGFPWNLPSYIWVDSLIGQNLSWLGAYGLNIFVFALAACLALIPVKRVYAIAALGLWGLLSVFGLLRIPDTTPVTQQAITIVQPNVAQIDKWHQDKEWDNFEKLLTLSKTKQPESDLILWPETAITWGKDDIIHLKNHLTPMNSTILAGVTDARFPDNGPPRYYNSLVVLNKHGEVAQQYNKHHLVPFGEYVPLRRFLNFGPIATMGDFEAGPGPQTFEITPELTISPLICYEVIFPGRVTDKNNRPDMLVNITNDGWYLRSTGPYQHLAMSRARAIETGLPLARAANTGISAIIDPYGRIIQSLPLQTEGQITISIPQALSTTPFSHYGNKTFLGVLLILAVCVGWLKKAKKLPEKA